MINKGKTLANLIWVFMERFGAQGVTFIVSIILARILDPQMFGQLALITVFITIMQLLVDSGLISALVQKKDSDDVDFSSAFIFNLVVGIGMYFLMFVSAPFLNDCFGMEGMVWPIRVFSLVLIMSAFKNIQQAYITKNMKFKLFFFSTIGGTLVAAVIGIIMALRGYGIWALIYQTVINQAVDTVILWIASGYHPVMRFDSVKFMRLYKYGWKLLLSSLIYNIYNEAVKLFIGMKFTDKDLGFYNNGVKVPEFICTNFNSALDGVLFPAAAMSQDDKAHMKNIARRAIKIGTFIIMPLMIGLAVCAQSFVVVFLTEKWLPSVPYVVIFCLSFALYPIHVTNLNIIKAMGRSDLFLNLEIIKEGISVIALIVALHISPVAVAVSILVMSIVSIPINMWPNRTLIDYQVFEQIKDILPDILLSVIMGGIVYVIGLVPTGFTLRLIFQITGGMCFYIIVAEVLDLESYEYLKSAIREMRHRG